MPTESLLIPIEGAKQDIIDRALRISRFVSFDEDNDFQPVNTNDGTTNNDTVTEAIDPENVHPDILDTKILNPDTGHKIKVGSALKYDEKTKVYQAAKNLIKKKSKGVDAKGSATPKADGGDINKEKYQKYVTKSIKTLNNQFKIKGTGGKPISVEDALKLGKDTPQYQEAFGLVKDKMHKYKVFESFSKKKKTALLQMALNQEKMEQELGTTKQPTTVKKQKAPKGTSGSSKPTKTTQGSSDTKKPFVSDEELSKMKTAPLWKIWTALNKCAEAKS